MQVRLPRPKSRAAGVQHGTVAAVASGYYGMRNFGDNAILEVVSDTATRVGADLTVLLNALGAPPTATSATVLPPSSLVRRFLRLSRADCLVFGGGGLIKDSSVRGGVSAAIALLDVLFAAIHGIPTIAPGIGVGEIRESAGVEAAKRVLSYVDYIITRDAESFRRLATFTLPSASRLQSGADLVLAAELRDPHTDRARDAAVRRIGLCLSGPDVHWASLEHPELMSDFVEDLGAGLRNALALSDEIAFEVIGLQRGGVVDDIVIAQRALALAGLREAGPAVSLADATIDEAVEAFDKVDLLIAMRYHGVLLASRLGVPFVGLSWDEKVRNYLMDVRAEDSLIDLRSEGSWSLRERIPEVMARRVVISPSRIAAVEERARVTQRELESFMSAPPRRRSALFRMRAFWTLASIFVQHGVRSAVPARFRALQSALKKRVGGGGDEGTR